MTANTTQALNPPLRRLSERLRTPLPSRTRFLHELADDVHELTRTLTEAGLPPEEARRRALDALVPDDETLLRLEGIHASWYRRRTAAWSSDRLRRAERIGLAVAFLVLLASQTAAILRADFMGYVSPFLWPVLAAGSVVVLAVVHRAFGLWVKGDYRQPRRGLGTLLLLSGLPLVIALLGVWLDVVGVAATLQQHPGLAADLVVRSLIQDAAMLSIAILFALVGGLGWLVLNQWIAVTEDAHARAIAPSDLQEIRPWK